MGSCFSSGPLNQPEKRLPARPSLSPAIYVPPLDIEGFTKNADKETLRKIKGMANATSGELLLISYDIGTTACK